MEIRTQGTAQKKTVEEWERIPERSFSAACGRDHAVIGPGGRPAARGIISFLLAALVVTACSIAAENSRPGKNSAAVEGPGRQEHNAPKPKK